MELPKFPESYWLTSTSIPSYPKLEQNIEVDVAIVGAGITGITTAYLLSKHGFNIALIEAGQILTGTTGHTTAKITAQHGLIYDELIAHIGLEKTKLYYQANDEALKFIKQTVKAHAIPCDLKTEDAYIYTNSDESLAKLSKEFQAYQQLELPSAMLPQAPLPFPTIAAIVMNDQAQFNPIKYLTALTDLAVKQGVQIYENTTAVTVDKGDQAAVVTRDGHKIAAKHVLSCSHYPFHDGGSFYFARMYQERSYALCIKPLHAFPKGMYISAEEPTRSLRTVTVNGEEMVIVGGENHKTGQGICTIKHYEALQAFAEQTLSAQEILYRWSAQDLVTLDKLPFIGQTDSDAPNIYVATGYKKWGMTTGTAAALLLEKLVMGQESPYEQLFTPSRFYADPTIKQFIKTNADVAKHLVGGKLESLNRYPEHLSNDEGAVVAVNGKRAGAYRDQDGQLHIVDTTCTHMGCEVEWNSGERTWDCPCHGSRFSFEGEVLDGPAKKPLKKIN
ncbi:FAD-dependent oxidoreductase [Paenibacillus sp. GXUN7292]|uniref:FAD-dependent oxidoreductase n=1 Tax=Paenibacillus sp. GXUN7292 TaxID=3422499 RepID=UPI003D7E6875